MKLPRLPASVRMRLLAAFSVLMLAAAILALVGLMGLRGTDRALDNFRLRVFPDVSLSLELSQRTAAIAANAPYVAESTLPFQLQAEARSIRSRLAEVDKLAAAMPANSVLARDLRSLLVDVHANVEELIEVTRRDLFLQEDMREFVYRLDRLRDELPAGRGAGLQPLLPDIALVSQIDNPRGLEQLRERIEAQVRDAALVAATAPEVRRFVLAAVTGEGNVFAMRRQHFTLAERKSFLVIQSRTQAERLGDRVESYVNGLRSDIDTEAKAIDRAAYSAVVGIALITVACVLAAVMGMRAVHRSMRSLAGITQVMTRLASGDVEQSTPETARRDELGELARAFEVFRENAREIRRISNDLQDQSRLMETVFAHIDDGLSVFDRHGRLIAWNRQYGALLRMPPHLLRSGATLEEIQAHLPERVGPGIGPPVRLDGLNDSRQHEDLRFDLHFPDGRLIGCRSNPMPGGGFVTLYSDLTERRDVESRLRQAQKMEVLGQLTSGVAHDFNNLLTAIIGNVYLLQISEQMSARDRRLAERVGKAADRGATLTSRLLAFARRQNLTPQAVAVDALITDLADLMEYSVGSAISLQLDLAAGTQCVWVDKAQLENALLNLVINARDAMPDGGELQLATRVDAGRNAVRIDVSDTGQGMDESTLERIFEPFFTTKGLGSGLGLSIVYGFVMQSGGGISARSSVGRGTTFELSLPLAQPDAPASAAPQADAAPHVPPQRVLLVEDDADVRAAMCEMLDALGHETLVAKNADEALALLSQPVSLVISDVDLGGPVNGADLAREIALHHGGLPCILMSGVPYDVLSSRFSLGEPDLLLAKPFTSRQLEDCMRRALETVPAQG
jgi:signal transduction histidine kinase/CheY-like chemotaxis protein/HAMP domain-containing protein